MAKVKNPTPMFEPPTIEDIEIPMSFDEAVEEGTREPVNAGCYEFIISPSSKIGKTQRGRPKIMWLLQHTLPEYNKAAAVFYTTPLPWIDRETGKRDSAGINFLVDLMQGAKVRWQGDKVSAATLLELLVGKAIHVNITLERREDGTLVNNVQSIVK